MNLDKPVLDARKAGTRLVFSTIRQHAPLPRIDIAEITGLSPATVTSITADLLAKNLIRETPVDTQGPTKRGRPRVNLSIRSDAHLVVGTKLEDSIVRFSVFDFTGTHIASSEIPRKPQTRASAETVTFLTGALHRALAEHDLSLDDISGIGIAIPGVVNAPSGHVPWSPALSDRDIPLQDLLCTSLHKPVFVDNDANLLALGELRFGLGRQSRNFIVVTVEQGVGMGIVINGQIYRGRDGFGSELGHTKIQLDGALCRCGQRGCLEAYVGDFALLREARTTIDSLAGAPAHEQLQILLGLANSGDPQAQAIIDRAGRMFAMGLANVVNIFAPELIILSGHDIQYEYIFNDAMIAEMKKLVVQGDNPQIEVQRGQSDNRKWELGAAAYAIDGVAEICLSMGVPDHV